MKKYLFSLLASLLIISACNQSNEIAPQQDFAKEIMHMKTSYKKGLVTAASALKSNLILNPSNELLINEKGIVGDVLNEMRNSYFVASDEFVTSFSSSFGIRTLSAYSDSKVPQFVNSTSLSQLYNEQQMKLVKPFFEKF
ncbi:hypothetical protein [Rhodoflexus sp.]